METDTNRLRQITGIVLVYLVVGAVIAPFLVGPTAASTPSGSVGVPSDQVTDAIPTYAQDRIPDAAAFMDAGGFQTDNHAGSTHVEITTRGRAFGESHQPGERAVLALRISDAQEHEGRRVSIPLAPLREALGHEPEIATVTHENGSVYEVPVEIEDGYATVPIRGFSTNTVTFSGTASITGTYTDGSTALYDLGSVDGASDFTINMTGVASSETDTVSGTGISNGGTLPLNVDGTKAATSASVTFTGTGFGHRWDNYTGTGVGLSHSKAITVDGAQQPTNGSGGDPEISVTGHTTDSTENPFAKHGDGATDSAVPIYGDESDNGLVHSEMRFEPGTSGRLMKVEPYIETATGGDYGPVVDVYIVPEAPDGVYGEGTLVLNDWNAVWSTGWLTVDVSAAGYMVDAGKTYTVEFVTQGTSDGDSARDAPEMRYDSSASTTWLSHTGDFGGTLSAYARMNYRVKSEINSLSVSDDQGNSYSFGSLTNGQTKTGAIDLRDASTSLSFSGSGGGTIDYTLTMREHDYTDSPSIDVDGDGLSDASYSGELSPGATATYALPDLALTDDSGAVSTASVSAPVDVSATYTEHTETDSPTIDVNGNTLSHSGVLADGQTASYTGNTSWLTTGQNSVNVTLADPSADAPPMKVALDYSHTATYDVSTDTSSEAWTERVDVTKTWPDNQSGASASVPLPDSVISIRELTVYKGGTEVAPTSQTFENGVLDVGLGSVSNGEKTRVVVNASKVRVNNGSITVTSPTTSGDSLATTFELTSWNDDSYISVAGTPEGEYVHYLTAESWTSPEEYARITGSGQYLYLPKASAGSTATVKTVPMQVSTGGDVDIRILDPATPKFSISPGATTGDTVSVSYEDTISGETYGLRSVDRDGYIEDQATAQSPVLLETDDEDETWYIELLEDTGGTVGDPTGIGSIGVPSASDVDPVTGIALAAGAAILILGTAIVGRRTRAPAWAAFLASGLVAVVVIELLSGAVSATITMIGAGLASATESVGPALLLIFGLLAAWALWRVIKAFTRREEVNLTVQTDGGKK